MQQTIAYLKTKFETGDVPTQQDYWDFLESFVHFSQVLQVTGTSTTDIMSQKAITDAINAAVGSFIQHFKGTYTSSAALIAAHPTAIPGDYAYVDAGVGQPAQSWIWDNDDATWRQGSITAIAWGSIVGSLTSQLDLIAALNLKSNALFAITSKVASYTLAAAELTAINAGQALIMNSTTGDLTVPLNATVAFPVGTSMGVRGFANIIATGGVTVTGTNGTLSVTTGRTAILEKIATDAWILHNGSAVPTWSTTVTGGAIESTQAQAEAVASGAAANSLVGLSNGRGTSEHSLFYFFRKVLTLAWTWAAKQTFTSAPRFSSVNASEVLVSDSNKDLSSVSYSSLLASIDAADVLNAVAISSGTLTLAWGTATKSDFDLTSTATGNFTIAFTGSNMRRGRLMLRVTGTIVITMPSACVMDLFEKSVGRWDDSANTLTIIGSTASPFYMTFEKDSAGNIWVHCSNRGV